jgi:fibronectin type 3 domain-containing protein
VVFAPTATGTASANLTFTTSVSTSSAIALSGSGAAPPQHLVTLSWAADTSTVAGYNVYRGTTSGGPYTQIYSLDANTTYTDSTVQSGSTYYYVVTAVGTSGAESGYSNQVQAVVPSP